MTFDLSSDETKAWRYWQLLDSAVNCPGNAKEEDLLGGLEKLPADAAYR